MLLKEITGYLESIAPLGLQESYDNSGLLVGDPQMEVKKAIISLDCTEEVIDEAISEGADLIISHHPIVFTGLKKLNGKNYIERTVIKAIKNDIAIYAIHTNLDNVIEGVNAKIAEKLGLEELRILSPRSLVLRKLITFCPNAEAGKVRDALFRAGAGSIGGYDECSFNVEGYGTFRAGENTNAYVGEKGIRHQEPETRIEVVFQNHLETKVIQALLSNHPYEEVAYDILNLENNFSGVGSGVVGTLKEEMDTDSFLGFVKEKMNARVIRHTRKLPGKIKKVALCGGSGSFLLKEAIGSGAQAFITADYKYHQFFDAEGKILITDIGHYETEQFTMDLLLEIIQKKFPTFALRLTKCNTNPVFYF